MSHPIEYALSIGSNIDDREKHIRLAVDELSQIGTVKDVSSIYETEPWGKAENADFLNIAVLVDSNELPPDFLKSMNNIEAEMGRVRFAEWEPRIIDLDIIFAGNLVIDEEKIKIPHPFMKERRFVLEPLNEIASGKVHPIVKLKVSELLNSCTDRCEVKIYKKFFV